MIRIGFLLLILVLIHLAASEDYWNWIIDERGNYVATLSNESPNCLDQVPQDAVYLDISLDKVSVLPENMFSKATALEEIKFFSTSIQTIPKGIFKGLEKLTSIEIRSNSQLTLLPDGVFDGLTNLQNLDLSSNKLGSISQRIFDGLYNLQNLTLSDNIIDAARFPLSLVLLNRLDLARNKLENLSKEMFSGLTHIQFLDLSQNLIRNLSSQYFEGLCSLNSLRCDGNLAQCNAQEIQVYAKESCISNCWNMDYSNHRNASLLQSENPQCLHHVPGDTAELYVLNQDSIDVLNDDMLQGVDGIKIFIMTGTKIETLPQNIFQGKKLLGAISISLNTQLSVIKEHVFADLPSLEVLTLTQNNIKDLSQNAFSNLPNLYSLDLSQNILDERSLKWNIRNLGSLTELNLAHNQIRVLPGYTFQGIASLVELDLSYNQISKIFPNAFDGLCHLQIINLEGNPVQESVDIDKLTSDARASCLKTPPPTQTLAPTREIIIVNTEKPSPEPSKSTIPTLSPTKTEPLPTLAPTAEIIVVTTASPSLSPSKAPAQTPTQKDTLPPNFQQVNVTLPPTKEEVVVNPARPSSSSIPTTLAPSAETTIAPSKESVIVNPGQNSLAPSKIDSLPSSSSPTFSPSPSTSVLQKSKGAFISTTQIEIIAGSLGAFIIFGIVAFIWKKRSDTLETGPTTHTKCHESIAEDSTEDASVSSEFSDRSTISTLSSYVSQTSQNTNQRLLKLKQHVISRDSCISARSQAIP